MSNSEGLASLKINRSRGAGRGSLLRWLFIVLAVAAAALVLASLSGPGMKYIDDYLGTKVSVVPVVMSDGLGSELSAAGFVVADRMSVLAFKGTGRLEILNVRESQEVSKGQIVAEIDHHELDAIIAQARSDVAEARSEIERLKSMARQAEVEVNATRTPLETILSEIAEIKIKLADAHRRFDRDKKLFEKAAMSLSQTEDEQTEMHMAEAQIETAQKRRLDAQQKTIVAEAQWAVAKSAVAVAESHVESMTARVEVLNAQLLDTRIFSPFDGVVIEKAAEIGEIVAPISIGGSMARGSIVTIAERRSLQAEVDVAEKYIAKIKEGMRASVEVDAFPGKPLAGKVLRILPRANRSKATVQVRVGIEAIEKHREVLPDMGVRVKFLPDDAPAGSETSTEKVPTIPQSALQGPPEKRFVWTVLDNKATRTPIVPGTLRGDSVEIKKGLAEGQKVIVKGPENLREDGQKVRLAE